MPRPYEASLMSYLAYQYKGAVENLSNSSVLNFKKTFFPGSNDRDIRVLFFDLLRPVGDSTFTHRVAKHLFEAGWVILDVSDDHQEMLGYRAITFINRGREEIVIAHRGTTTGMDIGSKRNYEDDIEILKGASGNIPQILDCSVPFIVRTVRNRNQYNVRCTIFQTGHSLGGFLAEFGAAYVADPKFLELPPNTEDRDFRLHIPRIEDANAVTFDSLGCVSILNKLRIQVGQASTTNYFIQPNIANTANLHDGTRFLLLETGQGLAVTERSANVSLNIARQTNLTEICFLLETHKLENMIRLFDPVTGEPYNSRRIIEWPTASNTFRQSRDPIIPAIDEKTTGEDFFKIVAGAFVHGATKVVHFEHRRAGGLVVDFGISVSADVANNTASNSQTAAQVVESISLATRQNEENNPSMLTELTPEFNQFPVAAEAVSNLQAATQRTRPVSLATRQNEQNSSSMLTQFTAECNQSLAVEDMANAPVVVGRCVAARGKLSHSSKGI